MLRELGESWRDGASWKDLKPIPSADAIAPLKFGKYLGGLA